MSLKTLHCKMVFEILAISIFFHKYNPPYSMSVKKTNTKYFLFFEVPTHMFPFLKYAPFGKKKTEKVTVLLKTFHAISFLLKCKHSRVVGCKFNCD